MIPKTPISKNEMQLILRLFDAGYKQRVSVRGTPDKYSLNSIEGLVNRERERIGVKYQISTNTISKLSKGSKHKAKYERSIRSYWGYKDVIIRIMKCLRVNETIASRKYTNHIYLSGIAPYDFFDPNNRNLISIRYEAPTDCKAPLYFAFTSEDYDWTEQHPEEWVFNPKTGKDELVKTPEPQDHVDLWTVKTPFTYTDVITGRLSLDRITAWLDKMADNYQPIFVNTLIYKRDD